MSTSTAAVYDNAAKFTAAASVKSNSNMKAKEKYPWNCKHFAVHFCAAYNRCTTGVVACENNCDKLHVCRRWLAGCCSKAECTLQHSLKTEHNVRVLRAHGFTINKHICYDKLRQCLSRAFPNVCSNYNQKSGCTK
jgi:hypothetical protein